MSINPEEAFEFTFMGNPIVVSTSIVTQWIMIAVITAVVLLLTRNISKVPSKRQTVLEMIVNMLYGLVSANMGEEYRKKFGAFIGTLGIFMFFMNTSGLYGVVPSTMDINVTATFAMCTFFVINANAISKAGPVGYLHSYLKPYAPMLPLNLLEKVTIPLSLCLRLFINMLVGTIVIELVYHGLGHFAFLVPIPLHFFFDLFVGIIQTFVFMMLTMVYVKTAAAH